ncbi:MAG: trigger factor [Acaryochloridaceae cyanobacterium RL_2_7]|nr:trigger factor [Acaryochloridaceae cyanobacterium RL_2_7]
MERKKLSELNITQEKLPDSQIGLEIEIPGERSQRAYESAVKKLMKTAQIPGFRRGKIPRKVIMQRFGEGYLKASTLEELIQNILNEAIKQEDINVLGNLDLRSSFEELVEKFSPGEALTFSASADVPPEANLKKYTGFEVDVVESVFDASRVEGTLSQQQSQHATLVPVDDRAAQENDVVMVDFVSVFPDDAEDGDSGSEMNDFQVELSESRFLPGFVQGVLGMNIDETKEFDVDFPEDYFEQTLAGRTANFKVTLKDIKAKELPELTDDFAQEISEFETIQELKDFLTEQYQKEAETETNNRTKEALLDALIEELEIDLPKTLLDQEVNYLLNEMAARFQGQGIDINQIFTKESIPGFQARMRPDAEKRVKRTLALAEIAKAEKIKVEEDALEEKFVETLKQVNESKIDRDRLKQVIEDEMLEDNVVTWLKDNCTINLIEAPIEETVEAAAEEPEEKPTKKKAASKKKEEKSNDEKTAAKKQTSKKEASKKAEE